MHGYNRFKDQIYTYILTITETQKASEQRTQIRSVFNNFSQIDFLLEFIFGKYCFLVLCFNHAHSDNCIQQQMFKTRAQVLWLGATCGFHQHSDVTFQMHPHHSDDGEIDPAPFQV